MDAGNLEGIERVNERSRRGKFGWNVSPNIERASAAREKKKAPAAPVDGTLAARPPTPARSASLGRVIADYRTLVETCRARADELDFRDWRLTGSGDCQPDTRESCSARMAEIPAAKTKRYGP